MKYNFLGKLKQRILPLSSFKKSKLTFLSYSTIKNIIIAMFIINTDIVAEKFTLFKTIILKY